MQAFGRRVVALHRLYTRATVTAVFQWRKQPSVGPAATPVTKPVRPSPAKKGEAVVAAQPKRRLGTHKLPWYRGHRGVVKTTGAES